MIAVLEIKGAPWTLYVQFGGRVHMFLDPVHDPNFQYYFYDRVPMQVLQSVIKSYIRFSIFKALQKSYF